MSLFITVRNFLRDPRLIGVNPDSDELLTVHGTILREKQMMNGVFSEFYDTCIRLDKKFFAPTAGKRIEIGAGVSFFKQRYPEIVSTDVKKADNLDLVVDAQNMPFAENSIHAIYGINCFHHFPEPDLFFHELERVLEKGCGCVLIDPYYGWTARRFYKKIFDSEIFDVSQRDWSNASLGFMNGANQALSFVVFKRDTIKFETRYPDLEIVLMKPMNNYIRYLLSGGLNFKQLMPSFMSPIIKGVEFLLIPLNSIFALHHVIVLRKRGFTSPR